MKIRRRTFLISATTLASSFAFRPWRFEGIAVAKTRRESSFLFGQQALASSVFGSSRAIGAQWNRLLLHQASYASVSPRHSQPQSLLPSPIETTLLPTSLHPSRVLQAPRNDQHDQDITRNSMFSNTELPAKSSNLLLLARLPTSLSAASARRPASIGKVLTGIGAGLTVYEAGKELVEIYSIARDYFFGRSDASDSELLTAERTLRDLAEKTNDPEMKSEFNKLADKFKSEREKREDERRRERAKNEPSRDRPDREWSREMDRQNYRGEQMERWQNSRERWT